MLISPFCLISSQLINAFFATAAQDREWKWLIDWRSATLVRGAASVFHLPPISKSATSRRRGFHQDTIGAFRPAAGWLPAAPLDASISNVSAGMVPAAAAAAAAAATLTDVQASHQRRGSDRTGSPRVEHGSIFRTQSNPSTRRLNLVQSSAYTHSYDPLQLIYTRTERVNMLRDSKERQVACILL